MRKHGGGGVGAEAVSGIRRFAGQDDKFPNETISAPPRHRHNRHARHPTEREPPP